MNYGRLLNKLFEDLDRFTVFKDQQRYSAFIICAILREMKSLCVCNDDKVAVEILNKYWNTIGAKLEFDDLKTTIKSLYQGLNKREFLSNKNGTINEETK